MAMVRGSGGLVLRMTDPRWPLFALVAVELSNVGGVLGVGLLAPTMAWGVASVGVTMLRDRLVRLPTGLVILGGVWLAARLVTLVTAVDPAVSWATVAETGRDLIFLAIVSALLAAVGSVLAVVRLSVAVLATLALISVVNQFAFGGAADFAGFSNVPLPDLGTVAGRHAGPLRDVNFWGRLLVLFVPLGISEWAIGHEQPWRAGRHWGWAAAVGLLCGGILLTGSRGALLSLGFVILAWPWLAGPRFRRLALGAVVAVVLTPLLLPGVASRLATVAELQPGTVPDQSISERVGLQRIAADVFLTHPLVGVGPGNFSVVFDEHRSAARALSIPALEPHNLYLQIGAEQGVVGLAGWAVFYLGAIVLAGRSLRGAGETRVLAAGAVAGLVGYAVASVPLHLANPRALFLVMAIGAAVGRDPAPVVPARPETPRYRALALLCVAVATVVAPVTAFALGGPVSPGWVADVAVQVRPADPSGGLAYQIDLLSRERLMPTLAVIAAPLADVTAATAVEVGGGQSSTILTISAQGGTPFEASSAARAAATEAVTRIDGLDLEYALDPLPAEPPARTSSVRWMVVSLASMTAVVAGVVAAGVMARVSAGSKVSARLKVSKDVAVASTRAKPRPRHAIPAPSRPIRPSKPIRPSTMTGAGPPWRPFSANSTWNTPLDAASHERGSVTKGLDGPVVAHLLHGAVSITELGGPQRIRTPVGDLDVSAHARPAPGPDGGLVVVDRSRALAYELGGLTREGHRQWTAETVQEVRLDGDGAGSPEEPWPSIGGVVRLDEIRAGVVPHAVAVTSNAIGVGSGVQVGTRLGLDPGADVGSSGLTPVEEILVRALKEFGAVIVGSGSEPLGIRFECPFGLYNPYPSAGLWSDGQELTGIPPRQLATLGDDNLT